MISATIEAMIEEIGDALQQQIPVRIGRLGTLSPVLKKNRKMRDFQNRTFDYGTLLVLKFRPSAQLVEKMRSPLVEKYGVVTEKDPKTPPGEKRAHVKNDQDRRNANVPISNERGTQPWEPTKAPDPKK